ncbi:hypothetical protein [uncultured Aquimarina sp.]|uniref:hypothetical protein n=1 Tax=uncultured Aquimarina sp. TaxID=575652 RepID=UPI0026072A58|nr:hypothetical protein [uncultured Aquimarina sp.]
MQNFNLLEWNLKYFHQNKYGYKKSKNINDQILSEAAKIKNYNENQSYIKNEIFTYLKKDPIGYGIFHLKGCLRIFIDPGRFDLVNFFKIKDDNNEGILHHINEEGIRGVIKFLRTQPTIILLSLFIILIFNFLKLTGFIWFWIKNYKRSNLLILSFLFVILYIVALTGPLGASRFFVPILPTYLMFSVLGFTDLIHKLKHFRFYKKDKTLLN